MPPRYCRSADARIYEVPTMCMQNALLFFSTGFINLNSQHRLHSLHLKHPLCLLNFLHSLQSLYSLHSPAQIPHSKNSTTSDYNMTFTTVKYTYLSVCSFFLKYGSKLFIIPLGTHQHFRNFFYYYFFKSFPLHAAIIFFWFNPSFLLKIYNLSLQIPLLLPARLSARFRGPTLLVHRLSIFL